MREKVAQRADPTAAGGADLEHGVSAFLGQLSETLRLEETATPFAAAAIGVTAARHGRDLLGLGFNVSQVVHDYGDICQAITELALEQGAPIGIQEFHILNRCLDTAIAEAVTEHARITAEMAGAHENERRGHVAHELRNSLNTALLAFRTLSQGTVAINGSTGMVLGRSLMALRDLVDASLSEVRLDAGTQQRERLTVAEFIDEIAVAAHLHAEYRGVHLSVAPVPREWVVMVDPQILGSALMNLLNNAFKFTSRGGRVLLRGRVEAGRVLLEVEDQCGGIPDTTRDLFQPFGGRRATDGKGVGLGLSIARKAVASQDGNIAVRNMPGTGCVFAINLPLAPEEPVAPAIGA